MKEHTSWGNLKLPGRSESNLPAAALHHGQVAGLDGFGYPDNRHAPATAGGTEAASLAGKGHYFIFSALLAVKAAEAPGEGSIFSNFLGVVDSTGSGSAQFNPHLSLFSPRDRIYS